MKTEELLHVIKEYDFDYLGIQEINIHERILSPTLKWKRRFPHHHTQAATNVHCPSQRRILHGGTAHFIQKDLCLRQISNGQDPTGLGRWIWTLLQGRQGIQIRIISGYRPVDDRSNRPFTVYSQHEYYFNNTITANGYRNPRTAFFEDLDNSIKEWMAAGDQIILGIDANEDIHTGTTSTWTTAWGLVDALKQRHPTVTRVATCNKNMSNTPIDGIFISPGLNVQAAGMTGFGELYPDSDHRLLWVDIKLESLFGFLPPTPAKRPINSLPIRDPKAIKKYNRYVKSQLDIHRITEKTFSLESKAMEGEFGQEEIETYNKILFIQNDIRRRARRLCRRFYTSQISYTDELGIIYRRRKLWKMILNKRQNIPVDLRTIRRLMKQVHETNALQLTIDEVEKKLRKAIVDWKEYKKEKTEKRKQFEERVDKRRAQRMGTSTETQKKQRLHIGSTRTIFRRIRQVMKPVEMMSINTVEYTTETGATIECVSRDTIEQACMTEGQRRFSQAQETPFLQGSLLQQLGYNEKSEAARTILQGNFQPEEDINLYTRQFITELKRPSEITTLPEITGFVTTEEHCRSWKRMRLNTGSSPYGPLYCDYIAGTEDSLVAEVDASLSSIPFLAGFSPQQWQEATDVMIPKKKSSRHVQKLRIIVLFDAMFNMTNKRIAKEMIRRAQITNQLPNEAYGGVPGRCATTCSLNKILALDLIRMERRTATVCSNDAKSCYDRIVHSVASICMQRLGVAEDACFTMFKTLQDLNHHVRTAYGERARGYGAVQIPLHGVGQGNGAGPAIWLAITIPLINMLRKAGFGLQVVTPITGEQCSLACFIYVDDADSIHAPAANNITANMIAADTQKMLDTWAGGLFATGGKIEATKSYWYLIDFKWNKKKMIWEYKSIDETPATLHLRYPGSESTPLARKEVWEPDPDGTLGTFIAMDGNQKMIIAHLTRQIDTWADKIRTKQLTTMEGWLSFRTGISMSIRHQLATSRLEKKDCKNITRKLKLAILQASGIPITYPDSLVYSPREFLGLGLPDFWHLQATLFVENCLQHGPAPDNPTGILLRTIIQNMRLEMGVSKCPLSYPFQKWNKCTTKTQFSPLWEYASDSDLELRDGLPDIPPARLHDVFLMEAFEHNGATPGEMRLLNLCRIHLRIYLLSDLCTGNGKYLDKPYVLQRRPFRHHNRYRWPPSPSPNASSWRLWQDFIINCFTSNHHEHPYRLRRPLGPWITRDLHANTYLSPREKAIYQTEDDGNYTRFRYFETRHTRHPTYIRTISSPTLPPDAIPTTTYGNYHSVSHTGIADYLPRQETEDEVWWGIVVKSTLPIEELVHAIKQGTAVAVTDGSYRDNMGTAAFTFRASDTDRRELTLVNMTPGMEQDLTPYRAEMGGLYGIAKFLERLHKKFNITGGEIQVVCDCKSALDRVMKAYPPKPKQSDYDLCMEIHVLKRDNPVKWLPCWVRGHQDDFKDIQELEPLARLNIEMDQLAKQHWHRLDVQRPAPFSLPSAESIWSIWSQGHRVTTWNASTKDAIHYNPVARRYWSEKYASFPDMDYNAIRLAYQSLPLFYQLRVPKWIGRRLPVGAKTAQWVPGNPSNCPRCGVANETHDHVILCQHPGVVAKVSRWLDQLELWLAQNKTHPDLRFGIMSLLRATFRETDWVPPRTSDPLIRSTFRRQQNQGTQNIMYGWWANGWAETQHAYLSSISRRTTGYRWLSRLIKKQWEISWDLWRHRMEVAAQPDSFSLALAHENINEEVRVVYQQYSSSTYQPLRRWFQQPLHLLLQQQLTFKQDWLVLVQSFRDPE